ncbi:MAG TPA: anaerobic carbon-monoxide dehydrogenase catalytic subunit [Bacillota bacterium]|jgi:carbon-monoxide dehydrogenase catalytic subunit|nr:anaerobic carbon-monoxide dehydrogenase catalytic subunit [Bacillota bacterium]HOB86075.1 anaerobic carbon-monoxide dehydrogenase catalytic subunit [Bacillota bacterium]HOP69003.1 anaerobic carbon-monoxide dehydrogenase catalytic subunit [Bacillota bacterium]HPT34062.1 anaerobic carbon-monoxide dehydrogenase catalytic subunit [Bacillota bacterium]HPZ64425.1 anaerobic carbon-monoxide dehydrogenase catalytic subunit [Bacillota bacterium]
MSEEKKKVDNKRTIDPAALAVLGANEGKIETAYDRYVNMQPQCNFGRTGICCRICLQGPCRITKKSSKGICGAHSYTIVARNLIRSINGGTSAHADHSRHMLYALKELLEGKAPDYAIEDPEKLHRVARRLGLSVEGKEDRELLEEVVKLAESDFIKLDDEPCKWLETTVVEGRMKKFHDCNIQPRSVHTTIAETMGQTHMGVDADPVNLIFQGLKTALADYICMHIATDLSDILFGTPKPVSTEANLGVLDPEMVNIAVHGHNPLLSEMIVRVAREMTAEAQEAGAKGIKCMGICCTGNEVLMRQGVPVLTNFLSQELPIMTGALDAMVVDVQCIMPGIRAVAECFHTRIITTMSHSKIPGSYHVDFSEAHAVEKAREVIELAIGAFKERQGKAVDIPQVKHKVTAGFSVEALEEILKAVNPEEPYKVITDAIEAGQLRGVVLLCGCNNLRVKHDESHSSIIKGLAQNNVLMVVTGCAAGTAAKMGLMNDEAVEQYAGEGLKEFFRTLNEANKDRLGDTKLPLVFHMGSCVDNSRAYDLVTALALQWGIDAPKVPFVASAPEAMSEKAVAIGTWFVTLGIPTHVGVTPEITGSALVDGVALQIADDVYGGYFMWEEDPVAAVDRILAALDDRTWKLRVHKMAAEKYETSLSTGW